MHIWSEVVQPCRRTASWRHPGTDPCGRAMPCTWRSRRYRWAQLEKVKV